MDIVSGQTDSREIETVVSNPVGSRKIVINVFNPAVNSFGNVAYRILRSSVGKMSCGI